MKNAVNADIDLTECGVVDDPDSPAQPFFQDIEKPAHIDTSGFFNPTKPGAEIEIVLERFERDGKEVFRLREPIGYWDSHIGGIVVPHNMAQFATDLISVPQLLTWLVPRTGTPLAAALIHDGLIPDPQESQTYIAREPISWVTADRIFRDSMRDLGATLVTRWLLWAAVAAASKVRKSTNPQTTQDAADSTALTRRLWGWFVVLSTVITVAVLGTIATLEIADCITIVPGMAGQTKPVELTVGFAAAIATPSLLSVLWGSQWRAGIIAGVAMSLLLHIMAALVVVFGLFKTADYLSAGRVGQAALWFGASASIVGSVAAIIAVFCN